MIRRFRDSQQWQLILANVRELIREPGVLFWGIIFPILMSLGLGIAFMQKADVIRHVAFIDRDTTNYVLTLKDDKLGNTIFYFEKMKWDDAMVQLKRGHVNVIITGHDSTTRYHFDPMNSDAQLTYLKLYSVLGKKDPAFLENNTRIEPLTLKGTRYIDFLIPGLISMGVMFSCLWGVSYSIIEKRSRKLLRRMVATPMKKSNYLVSLVTVRIAMNFVESGLLLLFAWLAFGITIQGNIGALLIVFLAGNAGFAGMSVFIASHTSKTEIGNGLINAVTMPMMVLSGVFFSYHNFPDWVIPFIKPLPLTMLADGIRSIFIEGAGYSEILLPSTILVATGAFFFTIGLRIFKWH
jgi:ABC-2 type transport system permease protein